ncbi:hypothetical protein CA85_11150 [Allorhodopirellula solitaria]|uniref:Uncharacterized protein n=1 Tax=Allorhodopirellula solitaria TaxID=2527987 RepID=A0A5C5YGF5_9BACT|nr:hypothetical protein CA85_11150 [Allorhodopirellula solitaria]
MSTDGSDRRENGHSLTAQTGGAVWLLCRPTAPSVARTGTLSQLRRAEPSGYYVNRRLRPSRERALSHSSDGRSRLATMSTDGSDRRENGHSLIAQTGGAVWLLCQPTAPTVARTGTLSQLRRAEPSGYYVDRRLRPSRERALSHSSDGRSRLATLSTDGSDRRENEHSPTAQTGGAVWLLISSLPRWGPRLRRLSVARRDP